MYCTKCGWDLNDNFGLGVPGVTITKLEPEIDGVVIETLACPMCRIVENLKNIPLMPEPYRSPPPWPDSPWYRGPCY